MLFDSNKFSDENWDVSHIQHAMYAGIAREYYVSARLALIGLRLHSAALLMEQSIELYIKAFMKLNERTWSNGAEGHNLTTLLNNNREAIDLFKIISADADYMDLIKDLQDGYNNIRYGESWIGVNSKTLQVYDQLMFMFINQFHSLTNIRGADYVDVNPSSMSDFSYNLKTSVKIQEAFQWKI